MSLLLPVLVAALLAVVFGLLERRRAHEAQRLRGGAASPRCAAATDACPSCTAAPPRDRESCHVRH